MPVLQVVGDQYEGHQTFLTQLYLLEIDVNNDSMSIFIQMKVPNMYQVQQKQQKLNIEGQIHNE